MRKEYYYTIRENSTNKLIGLIKQYKSNNSILNLQDTKNFTVQKISYKKYILLMYFFICRWYFDLEEYTFQTLYSYNIAISNNFDKINNYKNELYELIDCRKNAQ